MQPLTRANQLNADLDNLEINMASLHTHELPGFPGLQLDDREALYTSLQICALMTSKGWFPGFG